MEKARQEIRNGFLKNRDVTDAQEIDRLVKHGRDVKLELEASVARVSYDEKSGHYRLHLKEQHLTDNALWPPPPPRKRNAKDSPQGSCGASS